MNYPKVIILIPIKNVAKYIRLCLDALLGQAYPQDEFEIWLLDNNSTDGTLEIVAQYPREKVKVFQMGIDSPPIKYNRILPKVKSEIVGFVDGDAIVVPDWLEKVAKPLEDPEVAGASGSILTANPQHLVARVVGYELQDRYERLPQKIKRVATMHAVYKKRVLEEIGGFNEKLKTGYDCEIGHRINERGYEIRFVPEAKVYHHHRPDLWSYLKQQYEYGQFALLRYLEKPEIAKGDEVSSIWMIAQPLFYLATLILFFSFLILKSHFQFIFIPILILITSYIYSSIRIANKYKDPSAVFLILIYIIRPIAWSLGASIMLLQLIKNRIFSK